MRKLIFILIIFFCSRELTAQSLSITASTIAGTCIADAQINVAASGGAAPYQFRLLSGPSGLSYPTAFQSSSNFAGLKAGTYSVQVMDQAGAFAQTTVLTSTSYINLAITSTISISNTCPVSPDGKVTITRTGGKAPYSYSLLQGASIAYGPQVNNNIFTGVANGTYTAQVIDACGEIRTYSTSVALNDYKWANVKNSDNGFITSGVRTNNAATPFDTTKLSFIYDGPLQFDCDSITFRMFNTLSGTTGGSSSTNNVLRRIYIKDLGTGVIVWDKTFLPANYTQNSSPSVHLKINTNYRFYFDDLCNDLDSADRNYNYNNSDNYTINANPLKTCTGLIMNISHPSDWNSLNQYNSPHDTITIVSSSLPGDTVVGKKIIQHYEDYSLSQPLYFEGVSSGATYMVQIKSLCNVSTQTVTISPVLPTSLSALTVRDQACKINTASGLFNFVHLAISPGYVYYSITSGPASFTDVKGTVYSITYPIQDSILATGNTQLNVYLRNLPKGDYTIHFTDQCGNAYTRLFTITESDLAKILGNVLVNQQCPGASSITFNGTYQHIAGQLKLLKKSGSVYSSIATTPVAATTAGLPSSITFTALGDGEYQLILIPISSASYLKGPVVGCDTLFMHFDTLLYKLPSIDSADSYLCTPGGNDGKITLFPNLIKGVRPFQYQRIDATGNPLTPYQSDSSFTGLTAGTYTFRIKDACGNATIFSKSVELLKPAQITTNNNCPDIGSPFILTADSIFQASYIWTFTPAGGGSSLAIGSTRTITIPAFSPANYGTYTVSYTKPGCTTVTSKSILVSSCTSLPLKLLSFSAELNEHCIPLLSWLTTEEVNLQMFRLEASVDAANWQVIKELRDLNNNKPGVHRYQFSFPSRITSTTYYRLAMVDIDGKTKLSDVLLVKPCGNGKIVQVFPNPASEGLGIRLNGFNTQREGKIINAVGQVVKRLSLVNGSNMINISELGIGLYTLIVMDEEGRAFIQKIMVKR